MRVVLDSNVILSAVLFGGVPERIAKQALKNETLVLSPYIVEEVSGVLEKKFKHRHRNVALLEQLLSQAQIQYFQPFLQVMADEPDNRILETAVTGEADYIVTGDKLLLGLGSFEDVKVMRPADFLLKLPPQ